MGGGMSAHKFINMMRAGQEDEAVANVDKLKSFEGKMKSPILEACRLGCVKVVMEMMRIHDSGKKKISQQTLDQCLLVNADSVTDRRIIRLLVDRGADIEAKDGELNTPLINLCRKGNLQRKTHETTPEILAHRREAALLLIVRGAKFEESNIDNMNALTTACEYKHEKLACTLVGRGADLKELEKWMALAPKNEKNWCAKSVMSKYVWDQDTTFGKSYVARLKKKFMGEFDSDGSGELEADELLRFIAMHVKMQFQAGLNPVSEFDGTDLDIEEIATLLKRYSPDLIKGYMSTDMDDDGKYTWDEILPIITDFFNHLWSSNRPPKAGEDEQFTFNTTQEEELGDLCKDSIELKAMVDKKKSSDKKTPAKKKKSKKSDAPVVPLGWKAVKDEKSDKYYYVNEYTKKSQWVKPVQAAEKPAEEPLPSDDELPDGWKAVQDPKSGKTYYYHKETKKTTWTKPTA